MSTPLISPTTLGDLVKRESDPDYTRETVTLKAGSAYPLGAVLGRITAPDHFVQLPLIAIAAVFSVVMGIKTWLDEHGRK